MITIEHIGELRGAVAEARARGARIGFVPTMGYLHDGHLALVERARRGNDLVVVSIFVNPTQFAPGEDFAAYPRDPEGDAVKLAAAGCDLLYLPLQEEIYPEGFATYVNVEGIATRYEGAHRPTHFRGVATVVATFFSIVAPDEAVFGQKDAQQVAVVRRMTRDLHFPTIIVTIPTMREADGLAMSSRNVYLSADDRREALSIHRALRAAAAAIDEGAGVPAAQEAMRRTLSDAIAVDYADVINAETFQPAVGTDEPLLAVFAGRVGRTRLIDNMPLGPA